MKKFTLCFLALMLFGCSTTKEPVKKEQNAAYCDDEGSSSTCGFEKHADMSTYEGFDAKDSMFYTSSMDAVLKTFKEKKSGVFYFGYPDCPWCIEALPILNAVAKKADTQLQYIRTRDDDKELLYTQEQKKTLLPYVKEFLNKDEEGEYQLYVPFVVVVKEGKAISGHIGTVEGYDTKERKMNDKEKQQLSDIYTAMLK